MKRSLFSAAAAFAFLGLAASYFIARRIRWGDFISALRRIGYDGVLSVEHEDSSFPAEEGFVKAARYLNTLV